MPKIPPSGLLIPALLLVVAGALGHAVIAKPDSQASVSLQELRNFSEAFALIKRQYVDEVDDSTLMRNAMRGMASKLDPYTTYLDREELDDWEVTTSGEFGGLGIVVTKDKDDSAVKVVSPIDDTPASARDPQRRHDSGTGRGAGARPDPA